MKLVILAAAAAASLWGFFGPSSKEKPLLQKLEEDAKQRHNIVEEFMGLTMQ